MDDVESGQEGFKVRFDGTEYDQHVNWKWIINNPSSLMIFGPPREVNRSFDDIFIHVKGIQGLHQRFLAYYDEFEGDVKACLSLYNSYLASRLVLADKQMDAHLATQKNYDGNIFRTKPVINFLDNFDRACEDAIEFSLLNFVTHSDPIVPTDVMTYFISQAPAVFGDMWDLMCKVCGIKTTHSREEHRTRGKTHEVFFRC